MRIKKHHSIYILIIFLMAVVVPSSHHAEERNSVQFHKERMTNIQLIDTDKPLKRFTISSPFTFSYPDKVRGIYVTGQAAGSNKFQELLDLVDGTALNSMVIDIKDDHGYLTFQPEKDSPYRKNSQSHITDPERFMETLEEKQIYPIARIVVFKDSVLAKQRPELSFTENGKVWTNNRGEAFVNPFEKEVWEYNVEIAKLAAKMGFQEIQFDYVRFPEGFETRAEQLKYTLGDYEERDLSDVKKRVEAVTDFVQFAKAELSNYDVDVSVDIFGYAATIEETPGIGQNFKRIAEQVDVISSMIYPSHWSNNYFGIPFPDMEPYRLVSEYAKVENDVLSQLENPPISRPWIQDFEAPWIYDGPVKQYGKEEVEAQIKALYDNGIHEFLIWNAGNVYTKNVDYLAGN